MAGFPVAARCCKRPLVLLERKTRLGQAQVCRRWREGFRNENQVRDKKLIRTRASLGNEGEKPVLNVGTHEEGEPAVVQTNAREGLEQVRDVLKAMSLQGSPGM